MIARSLIGAFLAGMIVSLVGVAVAQSRPNCPTITPNFERICGTQEKTLIRDFKDIAGEDSCFEMSVNAASKWNASGVRLEKDKVYSVKVIGEEQTWQDGGLPPSSPLGWTVEEQAENLTWVQRTFISLAESFRRAPKQNWFHLMAAVAEEGELQVAIGRGADFKPRRSGEFCAFANDLWSRYENNSGSLTIRVTGPSN